MQKVSTTTALRFGDLVGEDGKETTRCFGLPTSQQRYIDTDAALIRAQRNEVHMLVPVERADVKRKLTTLYERIRLLVLRIIGYIVINYMFQSDSHGAEKV